MVPHTLSIATALKARNYGSAAPASVLPAGGGGSWYDTDTPICSKDGHPPKGKPKHITVQPRADGLCQ